MGHQAEDAAGGIAEPGDGVDRTVRVVGKFLGRRAGRRINVTARHAPGGLEGVEGGFVARQELSFAVADRQVHRVESLREHARRICLKLQPHPKILKRTAVVLHQRDGRFEIIPAKSRHQSEFGHDLEAIADAHDQPAVFDKGREFLLQVMPQPVSEDMAGGHVVAERKSANEHQRAVPVQPVGRREQIVDVHQFGFSPRLFPGELRLRFAV